ncbi:hypothetical protein COB57_01785 [Candidatus Peregrinibacteria bacterium]|nr:MAG: hypothetical protein COB57_01785 [Candidatus Peregrinibacteria bacterium]
MKNAIIIHGTCNEEEYFDTECASLSNSHWFPWLQKQLLTQGVITQTPEMLDAHIPDYKKWSRGFEIFNMNEETILIGYSCGGGFLTRWLSENPVKINKLILVAPWLDPEREKTLEFFDFKIDKTLIDRVNEIHLFVSSDDDKDILDSVETIKENLIGIQLHEYDDHGHFCFEDMGTEKFPALLEVVLR